MKKEMGNLCLVMVAGFIFIYLFSFISASSHTKSCDDPNYIMIRLGQEDNSHGALSSYIDYEWEICYDHFYDIGNPGSGSTGCNGNNVILWLSNETNGHASSSESLNYSIPVCFDGLSCEVENSSGNDCSNSNNGEIILRMSNLTNAHLADALYTDYPYKVCCAVPDLIRWENAMEVPITNADVGDTVRLVIDGISQFEGTPLTFTVYEEDNRVGPFWVGFQNLGDDLINNFIGVVEGGSAAAIWTIKEEDIISPITADYDEFNFDVEGWTSSDDLAIELDITGISDDPFNISIISPVCGKWFFADVPQRIKIIANDGDDLISGTLKIFNGKDLEYNTSFKNGGLDFNYSFPNPGNMGIVAEGINTRGNRIKRVSNVMSIDLYEDDLYIATCIDSPSDAATLNSSTINFSASDTIGYAYRPTACSDPQPIVIPISSFEFYWEFSDDDLHSGPGEDSDSYIFEKLFATAGANYAKLSANIKESLITKFNNGECTF